MFDQLPPNLTPILVVAAVVIIIALFIFLVVLQRTPGWLRGLADYMNFKNARNKETEIFRYSQIAKKFLNLKWLYLFNRQQKSEELYFGGFWGSKKKYTLVAKKDLVKPLIITNKAEFDIDWPYQGEIEVAKEKYRVWAQENYLLDNIMKSVSFHSHLELLFLGEENWLEFTDLNQILLVTDYQFDNTQEATKYISYFNQIKENL